MKGRKVMVATIALGRMWRNMIGDIADKPSALAARTYSKVASAQEFGAHHADEAHPGKQQQDAQQPPEVRHHHAGQDDQQIEGGQAGPDLHEALKQQIRPAAEVALHRARRNPMMAEKIVSTKPKSTEMRKP